MAKKQYYAVRVGLVPGIYKTWDECKVNVNGVPNSEFKGFSLFEEAENYLSGTKEIAPTPTIPQPKPEPPKPIEHCTFQPSESLSEILFKRNIIKPNKIDDDEPPF